MTSSLHTKCVQQIKLAGLDAEVAELSLGEANLCAVRSGICVLPQRGRTHFAGVSVRFLLETHMGSHKTHAQSSNGP